MDSTAAERRIRAYVRESPLRQSPALSEATGARVFLKLENQQETGSFKLRGAANKLLKMQRDVAARGIVAASNGNHALAVATIGQKLGIPVEIFVSQNLHPVKRSRIEWLRARVHAVKGDALVAELTARREADASGRPYVSPYNDADVVEGQGTIAVEVLRQLAEQGVESLGAIFVAVGGGGLIGGIGTHLKHASPRTEVVGCWPANSPALSECMKAGEIIEVPEKPTWSTSTAGGIEPGSITLDICEHAVDRTVLVSEDEILDAARRVYRDEDQRVEGAAGVAVAGFLRSARDFAGKSVVIVLCGGNADPSFENKVTQD
jgi:threonine dehydratase